MESFVRAVAKAWFGAPGPKSSVCTRNALGVGAPNARLCFLGEAPGADEDRLGEPFVGRAGQLLHNINYALTLRSEEVYILNNLKLREPSNHNPNPKD